jgi:phage repressor protein C with HTH and peptisase S24 domain
VARKRTYEDVLRELEELSPIMVPETHSPASAGPGTFADTEVWPYMPPVGERRHEYIAVPVRGNCMEPRIPEGSRVIVDKTAEARPGDIVLAEHDGGYIIKQLERQNGDLYLTAIQGRPPIKVTEETRIIGVVKYWGMKP